MSSRSALPSGNDRSTGEHVSASSAYRLFVCMHMTTTTAAATTVIAILIIAMINTSIEEDQLISVASGLCTVQMEGLVG